jgi:hypothetical protein
LVTQTAQKHFKFIGTAMNIANNIKWSLDMVKIARKRLARQITLTT